MLKKTLLIMLLGIICLNVYAQKEIIAVKKFTKSSSVSDADLATIRASVVAELSKNTRFEILDEDVQSTSEEDGAWANFIVEGKVTLFDATEQVIENVTAYIGKLQYSITAIDGQSKGAIYSENFVHPKNIVEVPKLTSINAEGAKRAALKDVARDIKKFMIKAFPNCGYIYGEDFEDKGDKLVSCHISIGEANGVKKGDHLTIFETQTKVGQDIEVEIGKLKVVEVYENISKCEIIKKYQKEVKEAFDRYLDKSADDPNAAPLRVKSSIR